MLQLVKVLEVVGLRVEDLLLLLVEGLPLVCKHLRYGSTVVAESHQIKISQSKI